LQGDIPSSQTGFLGRKCDHYFFDSFFSVAAIF